VNRHDEEHLSAYLDNALSPAERSALEKRLADDPELRQHLASLRQTVALVRQLPRQTAPRDFTLTPQMVGRQTLPFPLTVTFSALSTAAALLLLVFGGYFLFQVSDQAFTMPASEMLQPSAPAQNQVIAPTQIAIQVTPAALPTTTPQAVVLPTTTPPSTATAIIPTPTALPTLVTEAEVAADDAQMAESARAVGATNGAADAEDTAADSAPAPMVIQATIVPTMTLETDLLESATRLTPEASFRLEAPGDSPGAQPAEQYSDEAGSDLAVEEQDEAEPPESTQVAASIPVTPIALLIAGGLLLLVAVGTTLARHRRLRS
jgi:hypothetical protein